MDNVKLLIPSDYSKVSDLALKYVSAIKEKTNVEVYLLHIVKGQEEITAAKLQLKKQIERTGIEAKILIRVGSISSLVAATAEEVEADFVVMGTHGPKGVRQWISGSDAMKVISNSKKPFIVVQEDSANNPTINDIVVPLSDDDTTKQKLDEVKSIAYIFDSTVHIFAKEENDEFLMHKVHANVKYAENYYKSKSIKCKSIIKEGNEGLDEASLKYADSINAGMMAIVNKQPWNLLGGVINRREEHFITNKQNIPVLVVNPVDVSGDYTQ